MKKNYRLFKQLVQLLRHAPWVILVARVSWPLSCYYGTVERYWIDKLHPGKGNLEKIFNMEIKQEKVMQIKKAKCRGTEVRPKSRFFY